MTSSETVSTGDSSPPPALTLIDEQQNLCIQLAAQRIRIKQLVTKIKELTDQLAEREQAV
jgi:chorismate mutase